jgi:SAM-dependent methyltransferase
MHGIGQHAHVGTAEQAGSYGRPGRVSEYAASVSEEFAVVRSGYDRIGASYREWSQGNSVRLHWVRRLLTELAPGSVVLDLGCGPGEPATRMLAEHHRVVGVDGSLAQLRLAQQAAPAALLVHADMTRFAVRPASLDAVASFYALGHIPSHRHAPLFAAIAAWLRPGGLLVTSAPVTPGDETSAEWLGVPMFFGSIGADATRHAVQAAGLTLDSFEVVEEDEGDDHPVAFLWLVARRPGTV